MIKIQTVPRNAAVLLALGCFLGCAAQGAESDNPGPAAADEAEQVASASEALSGTTCLASASDDNVECVNRYADYCYPSPTYCKTEGIEACRASYDAAKAACNAGRNRIYRVYTAGAFHNETKVFWRGTVELRFDLSQTAYPGADPKPLYRCRAKAYPGETKDFPSKDPNCEGRGAPISILGYSVPSTLVGAKALYRCRLNDDHFLSTASNCEGVVNEGLIGYGYFL